MKNVCVRSYWVWIRWSAGGSIDLHWSKNVSGRQKPLRKSCLSFLNFASFFEVIFISCPNEGLLARQSISTSKCNVIQSSVDTPQPQTCQQNFRCRTCMKNRIESKLSLLHICWHRNCNAWAGPIDVDGR